MRFDKIVYSFGDSSVPPQYHRSYNITITEKDVRLTVDSYGDVLLDSTFQIKKEDWDNLTQLAGKIESAGEKIEKGMTGGTSQLIRLYENNKEIYKLLWDNSNSVNRNTEAFIAQCKSVVPDLGGLINKTRK